MLVTVFEESGEEDRRLHVHGEFVVTDNDLPRARWALRQAGGEWKKAPQHQTHTHATPPDEGWASYCGKELWKASPFLRATLGPTYLTDYADRSPIRVAVEVNKLARDIFTECRQELIKGRAGRSKRKVKPFAVRPRSTH